MFPEIPSMTMEQAAEGIRMYCEIMNEDPYYKMFIRPLMEERIRYSNSWRGKLIPWSSYDRFKRKMLISKIVFLVCLVAVGVFGWITLH